MSKLQKLLEHWPPNTVAVNPWLKSQGVSLDLKKSYIRNNWLQPIGRGAVMRKGDLVDWKGGLYAIQKELKCPVHIGGKTALELQGLAHFVRFRETRVFLYAPKRTTLPQWFRKYNWGPEIVFKTTNFLPSDLGLFDESVGRFSLTMSSPERAILEVLYMVPSSQSFNESHQLMQNLNRMRPNVMQSLLEHSFSIKVKRLALFLGEFLDHPWFHRLDLSKIDLGKGSRSVVAHGRYDPKYQITIPQNFYDESGF